MSPVTVTMLIAAVASALAWAASLVTRDYSWVDRLWSVLPVVFGWGLAMGEDSFISGY
jgi:steroid 5-alpha reductase family enzyme